MWLDSTMFFLGRCDGALVFEGLCDGFWRRCNVLEGWWFFERWCDVFWGALRWVLINKLIAVLRVSPWGFFHWFGLRFQIRQIFQWCRKVRMIATTNHPFYAPRVSFPKSLAVCLSLLLRFCPAIFWPAVKQCEALKLKLLKKCFAQSYWRNTRGPDEPMDLGAEYFLTDYHWLPLSRQILASDNCIVDQKAQMGKVSMSKICLPTFLCSVVLEYYRLELAKKPGSLLKRKYYCNQ